jgi:hypothetical protein
MNLGGNGLRKLTRAIGVSKVMDQIYRDYRNDQLSRDVDYAVLLERDGNTRLLRELENGFWVITDVEDLQSQTDSEGRVQVIASPAGHLLAIGSMVRTAFGRLLTVESIEMRCNGQYVVLMTGVKGG